EVWGEGCARYSQGRFAWRVAHVTSSGAASAQNRVRILGCGGARNEVARLPRPCARRTAAATRESGHFARAGAATAVPSSTPTRPKPGSFTAGWRRVGPGARAGTVISAPSTPTQLTRRGHTSRARPPVTL